jgi:hypothetical protein
MTSEKKSLKNKAELKILRKLARFSWDSVISRNFFLNLVILKLNFLSKELSIIAEAVGSIT